MCVAGLELYCPQLPGCPGSGEPARNHSENKTRTSFPGGHYLLWGRIAWITGRRPWPVDRTPCSSEMRWKTCSSSASRKRSTLRPTPPLIQPAYPCSHRRTGPGNTTRRCSATTRAWACAWPCQRTLPPRSPATSSHHPAGSPSRSSWYPPPHPPPCLPLPAAARRLPGRWCILAV